MYVGIGPEKDTVVTEDQAFVKCVAIHTGLGFDLWLKEEYNKMYAQIPETGENRASEAKIKTLKNLCVSHGINLERWLRENNRTEQTLTETEAATMLSTIKRTYGDD